MKAKTLHMAFHSSIDTNTDLLIISKNRDDKLLATKNVEHKLQSGKLKPIIKFERQNTDKQNYSAEMSKHIIEIKSNRV